ncbi:HNH endonuclease [Oceanobacillus massiliensis]|uniref:HNH endonuclease n=1 Tax=Oceanobacillus massiliensis TaxID=1465765 RepID=UPI0002890C69|nr:HNH endonuclease signature motif containing protein [Oceanobacillus massiliensis]
MPKRPDTPCKHPRCAKLVPYGASYCEEHAPLHIHDVKSTKEKGYDSRWRKARKRFLKSHPLCEKCFDKGKLEKAKVVDHIIPHRGDQELFWNETNWQPLCKPCHDRKTMTVDRYQEFKY